MPTTRRLGRRAAIVAAALACLLALAPAMGSAQVPIPGRSPTPTPSTQPPPPPPPPPPEPDPEPTESEPGEPSSRPRPRPRPTLQTPADPEPSPTPTRSRAGGARPPRRQDPPQRSGAGGTRSRGSRGTGSPVRGGPDAYQGRVSDAIASWLGRERSPAHSTARLLSLLAKLDPSGGPLSTAEIARGFGQFPVAGYVWYQDDWGAPRYKPYFHLHEGIDLFAQSGTAAIACVDGVIAKLANGSIGGISIWLDGVDGVTYYYGHLQSYAPGLRAGLRVRMGEVLGYVGDTGVAKGTYPHVHFEAHPLSGKAISAKPILDRWLVAAERTAQEALAIRGGALPSTSPARWSALLSLLDEVPDLQPVLWPSALDPTGTSLGFADLTLGALVASVDWDSAVASEGVLGADADLWGDPLDFSEVDPLGLYGY